MTRGQITIITKNKVITSIEFNGDMYVDGGYGEEVIDALKQVNDVANYQYEVAKFNNSNHHYNDIDALTYKQNLETLDFTKNYFENWFSDYIYIKNIANENMTIVTSGRDIGVKEVTLVPNAIAVLCFGRLEKLIKPSKK